MVIGDPGPPLVPVASHVQVELNPEADCATVLLQPTGELPVLDQPLNQPLVAPNRAQLLVKFLNTL